MASLLFLMLTAATPTVVGSPPTRRVVRVGTASATIIQAERIAAERTQAEPRRQSRQIRTRDAKLLIEFY